MEGSWRRYRSFLNPVDTLSLEKRMVQLSSRMNCWFYGEDIFFKRLYLNDRTVILIDPGSACVLEYRFI